MATNLDHDQEKPIAELACCFPQRKGEHPSTGKIRRWILRGVRGVRLEGRLIGAAWYTSPAAIERFLRQLNYDMPAASRPDPRKAAKVRRLLRAKGFVDETETMQDLSATG